jgi:hypothetical protein
MKDKKLFLCHICSNHFLTVRICVVNILLSCLFSLVSNLIYKIKINSLIIWYISSSLRYLNDS